MAKRCAHRYFSVNETGTLIINMIKAEESPGSNLVAI